MIFFTRRRHKPEQVDIGKLVIDKALEKARIKAQEQVRETLCKDCLDKRCLTGSLCKAFLTFTDAVAWEITAGRAEEN